MSDIQDEAYSEAMDETHDLKKLVSELTDALSAVWAHENYGRAVMANWRQRDAELIKRGRKASI